MARRKRRGRRSARSNFYSAGSLVNRPRRRRRSRRNPHMRRSARRTARRTARRYARNVYMPMNPRRYKRRYRRNPEGGGRGMSILGIQLPAFDAVLWVGAGLIAPPLITAQIMKFVPDSLKTNGAIPNWLMWVIKAVSAFVPPMLVRRFVNRRAGNLMLVGAGASFAIDALKTLAPGLIPGLGHQPLLGAYTRQPTGRTLPYRQNPRMLPPQISEAPERLSPQARF